MKVYEQGAVILWHKPVSSTELIENLKAVIAVCEGVRLIANSRAQHLP